jgi:hypothetical protein
MNLQTASLVPALTALAAALTAGGFAHINLIVSKETKTSEFRQAWINELRSELATFLANTRTMARAAQEARTHYAQEDSRLRETNAKFHITSEKITEIRHSVADTFYKIKLRLNPHQSDHIQLLGMLEAVTIAQNNFLANTEVDIESVLLATDEAAAQAARVLKEEWKRVKSGESEYRRALRSGTSLLLAILVLLIALVAEVFYDRSSSLPSPTAQPKCTESVAVAVTPNKMTVPAPAQLPTPKQSTPK